jgi:hypothetical protein
MTLFTEIAASCHHLLYPGPEPLAGPGLGVPLEAVPSPPSSCGPGSPKSFQDFY